MTESSAIDQAALDALLDSLGGDEEFLAELMQDYFDDSPNQIAAMGAALATSDAGALRRAAHSLKSNSATFGAMALSQHCKELEDIGKSGILDGAAAKLGIVRVEYERVRSSLLAI